MNRIANNPENPIPEPVVKLLLSDISLNLKFVAGMGFEPTYDQGYEPCELPVLYPTIYFLNWFNLHSCVFTSSIGIKYILLSLSKDKK